MNLFDSRRERAQILLAVLGIGILLAILPLMAGLVGALVLYVAASPIHRWASARIAPWLSAIGIVVATAALIFLPAAWLLLVVIDRAPSAIDQLRQSAGLARLTAMRVGDLDIGTTLINAAGTLVSWMSTQVLRVIGGAVR